eukprot:5155029-Pleurochrysis_carterae.AAC.1
MDNVVMLMLPAEPGHHGSAVSVSATLVVQIVYSCDLAGLLRNMWDGVAATPEHRRVQHLLVLLSASTRAQDYLGRVHATARPPAFLRTRTLPPTPKHMP